MRPSLLSAVLTGCLTGSFGFHVTTFAANEEGIVAPEGNGDQAKKINVAEEDETVAPSDAMPANRTSLSGGESETDASEKGGEGNTSIPAEEEMLDAESLLSEEELRALETEYGEVDDATAAESPPPVSTTAPEGSVHPEAESAASPSAAPSTVEQEAANGEQPTALEAEVRGAALDNDALSSGLGVATPLSRREPTLSPFQLEGGFRYGLVGTGPTRFVDDLRFSWAEGIELRTSFAPYPSSLMLRLQAGKSASTLGAWVIDAGIANWDAGWRLVVDTGEAAVGARVHWELVMAWQKVLTDKLSWFTAAHLRYRMSGLSDDEQSAVAFESVLTYDLMPTFSVSAGLGYAQTLGTPVREVAVSFVETGRPGVTHFLLRDDAVDEDLSGSRTRQSATIPLALTYGTTESFDVDLFCTPRIFPKFDIVFGAGLRVRYDLL